MEKERVAISQIDAVNRDRIVANRIREVQKKLRIQLRKSMKPSREQIVLQRAQAFKERQERGDSKFEQAVAGYECVYSQNGVMWRPERTGPRKLGSARKRKNWGKNNE